MNYLAHFLLSAHNPEWLAGNFIGDFVKGKDFSAYPQGIAAGIRMHRQIDNFTDSHPQVLATKKLLRGHYGKFAGVVADMLFDHLLAKYWEHFAVQPLPDFAQQCYRQLNQQQQYFPERSLITLSYMQRQNWLVGYAEAQGLSQALGGIAYRMFRRTGYQPDLTTHLSDVLMQEDVFWKHFKLFFAELHNFAAHWQDN